VALAHRWPDDGLQHSGFEVIQGTLANAEAYRDRLHGCDYVVHLAGNPRMGNGQSYALDNVEGTRALVDALAGSSTLKRFVFVSTIGAVDRAPQDDCSLALTEQSPPHPTSDYGRSKLAAERLVAESGFPFSIIRPAMVVGAEMRQDSHIAVIARAALAGRLLAKFRWPGRLSVVHVDDLVAALILAAESDQASGRTFFAAGGEMRLSDLFELAAPGQARVPLAPIAAVLRPLARWLPFAVKVLLYRALTADDGPLRELGWRPRTDWRDSVADVVARERTRLNPSVCPLGRTVVTGAASGLGRALAEALYDRGRSLLLIDRDAEGLARTLSSRRGVERVLCDLSDYEAVEALLQSDSWRREPIAELFSCAGVGLRGPVAALARDRQADLFRVNVVARLQLAQAAAQSMRQQQFGRIVLISSSSAFQALPFMAAYAASNAAVLLFGEALAAEIDSQGIEVLTVCPGGMHTNFQRTAGVRERAGERLSDPRDVAKVIIGALGTGKWVIFPSVRASAMALAARLLPRRVSVLLWRRLMAELR